MTSPDPTHFARAVFDLGARRPVVARHAIYNTRGVKILEAGVAISEAVHERLMQHTLKTPLEQAVHTEASVDAAAVREAAEAIARQEPFYARLLGSGAPRARLLDALWRVPLPAPVAFQLTVARDVHPQLWLHSVRTALVAAWLGRAVRAEDSQVTLLAAAGLLHDLGMLHVDPALLQAGQSVGREQRRQLYAHPLVTMLLLERHHEYPREVLRAVLEHHELADGSGYPKGLTADAISPFGRALALAEAVTGVVLPRHARAELRLSVLLKMNRQRYEPELVRAVLAMLHPNVEPGQALSVPDAAPALVDLDARLAAWPHEALGRAAGLTPARQAGMLRVAEQCERLRRTLLEAGVAPGELAQLGATVDAPEVQQELALAALEAAWQLRAVARMARRHWRIEAGESLPPPLREWLEGAEALGERLLGADTAPPVDDAPGEDAPV